MIVIIFVIVRIQNYGMDLVDALISTIILYLIVNYLNKFLLRENQIPKSAFKKSSFLSCLIILGIIFGVRLLLNLIGFQFSTITILSNDLFLFAIMVTLFFPFYKGFLLKFDPSHSLNDYPIFKRRLTLFIAISWIIGGIFLSFDLLNIELVWRRYPYPPIYDIFYLTLIWTFFTIFFNAILYYLINAMKPIEKKLPKEEIRDSMISAGITTFFIYSIQLVIVEIYFKRALRIEILIQDIRVLIILVTTIYNIIFFNLLKGRFLPKATIESQKNIQKIIKEKRENQIKNRTLGEENRTFDLNELDLDLSIKEYVEYSTECVSLKSYLYFLKRFGKLSDHKDNTQISEILKSNSIRIIIVSLWVVTLAIGLFRFFLLSIELNLIINIILISSQIALFMVLFDSVIMLLFNKLIPVEHRIQKIEFKKTILIGGLFSFWIWIPLIVIANLYFFLWISEPEILNLSLVIILSIIIFAFGIIFIRKYARMKDWIDSKRKSIILSLISLFFNLPLIIFYTLYSNQDFTSEIDSSILIFLILICFIAPIFVISFLTKFIYNKRFYESLKFMILVQLIIFLAMIVIGYSLTTFGNIITALHFDLNDIRVYLVTSSSIYCVSFLVALRFRSSQLAQKETKFLFEPVLAEEKQSRPQGYEGKETILSVEDLTTYFYTEEGIVRAVEGVSFEIYEGETLGLVGETGCGKSVTALSILRVVRPPGKIERGIVRFKGANLLQKSETEMLDYRGKDITMIFQDPLNSINPVFKIGSQISEVYLIHMENELQIEAAKDPEKSIYSVAREWSEQLLRDLNIPYPEVIYDRYPHELSGGMRQRIQIAMALACSPKLLIADEPTTALDVTVQNQILKLMKDLKRKINTSILFITHDLGIISKMCDRVAVMYSGSIVEYGEIRKLFSKPYHPYTRGLLASMPVVGKKRHRLEIIRGMVPNLIYPPSGCRFHPRCQYCFEPCDSIAPRSIEVEPAYFVACHLYDPLYQSLAEISIQKVEKENNYSLAK
ncbi:MAG: ABC transporter ATP-binding protein [Promethearchaeota archaeon]